VKSLMSKTSFCSDFKNMHPLPPEKQTTMQCRWKVDDDHVCGAMILAHPRSLKDHLQMVHPPPDAPENKALLEKVFVVCRWENCSGRGEPMQNGNIARHIGSTHPDVAEAMRNHHQCEKCRKVFNRIDAYRRHQGACCICKSCHIHFSSLREFERHKNSCPRKSSRGKRGRSSKATKLDIAPYRSND